MYRVVVLRKNISKMKGDLVLFDECRYFFYITTRTDVSPAEIVACANQRCDQENVFEQLGNGVNALREIPPDMKQVSNRAYMLISRQLAWNLKNSIAMLTSSTREEAGQQNGRMRIPALCISQHYLDSQPRQRLRGRPPRLRIGINPPSICP